MRTTFGLMDIETSSFDVHPTVVRVVKLARQRGRMSVEAPEAVSLSDLLSQHRVPSSRRRARFKLYGVSHPIAHGWAFKGFDADANARDHSDATSPAPDRRGRGGGRAIGDGEASCGEVAGAHESRTHPRQRELPRNGFEDREGHRAPSAPPRAGVPACRVPVSHGSGARRRDSWRRSCGRDPLSVCVHFDTASTWTRHLLRYGIRSDTMRPRRGARSHGVVRGGIRVRRWLRRVAF